MHILTIWHVFLSLVAVSESCFATPATSTSPCRTCAANLITITQAGNGAKAMDGDVIDRTTATCATRTFTCLGTAANNPNIEINNGLGTIQDADDGAVDGRTTFAVTCNTAGTAWESAGVAITQVECATGM